MELHQIIYLCNVARNLVRLAEKHNELSAFEAERLKTEFATAADLLAGLKQSAEGKIGGHPRVELKPGEAIRDANNVLAKDFDAALTAQWVDLKPGDVIVLHRGLSIDSLGDTE